MPLSVAPEPEFSVEHFEALPIDGLILLRLRSTPVEAPVLVIDGGTSERTYEPLPGWRDGLPLTFAVAADDYAAGRSFALVAGGVTHPLPQPSLARPPDRTADGF